MMKRNAERNVKPDFSKLWKLTQDISSIAVEEWKKESKTSK
jgi:hypothetical protein